MDGHLLQRAESHPYSTWLLNYAAFAAADSKSFISLALGDWKWIMSYSVLWYTVTMCEQNCYENIHTFFCLNTIHWVNSPEKTYPPCNQGNRSCHTARFYYVSVLYFQFFCWKMGKMPVLCWHIHTYLQFYI